MGIDEETAMRAMSLLAVAAALTLGGSHVLAKGGGGGGGSQPTQVKTSGTSTAPSGSGGRPANFRPANCPYHHCQAQPPGHTQPTCKGPHRGPNGVMIQCD
jgi:hypothetical protein